MKRAVLVGLSIGAGAVLAILLTLWGLYSYGHQSSPAKSWPSIEVQSAGIKANLKTELLKGEVLYEFRVSPVAAELSQAFDSVAKSDSYTKQFTIVLYDAGGFELCSRTITLGPEVDEKGLMDALAGSGKLSGCPASLYNRATIWNVRYLFPSLPQLKEASQRTVPIPEGATVGTPPHTKGASQPKKVASAAVKSGAYAVIDDMSSIMASGRIAADFSRECPGVRVINDNVSQPYGPHNAAYRVTTDGSFSPVSPNSGTMRVYGANGVTIYAGTGSLEAVVEEACSAIEGEQH